MTCNGYYCSQDHPNNFNPDWMKNIPSNCSISEITLAGTHDSCCRKTWEILETQAWTLADQLSSGIRFLDIRCRHINDVFAIHHNMVFCKIFFGDVIHTIKNFLNENPTETILMRIKEEYTPENNTRSFQDTFSAYVNKFEDLLWLGDYIPKLDEVRKKIIVLHNFYYPRGLSYNIMDIQDEYKVKTIFKLSKKKDAISKQCQKAINGEKSKIFANFCSGTGWGCFPFIVAKNTNDIPLKYKGRLGIVILDFPGEKLISHLIQQNFN